MTKNSLEVVSFIIRDLVHRQRKKKHEQFFTGIFKPISLAFNKSAWIPTFNKEKALN